MADEAMPDESMTDECAAAGDADPGVLGEKPTPSLPGFDVEELIIDDLIVGEGGLAEPGMQISVQYVGVLACDGQEFDASWKRGQPFDFQLGAGRVITGWDEGVAGMREGGRRQLTIPSDMAYGERGSGAIIGPNADLVFVVDLISIPKDPCLEEAEEPVAVDGKPVPTLPDGPVEELQIDDWVVGDGEIAQTGNILSVHYVGVLACNGQEFDASWNAGQPFTVRVGVGDVIPGWDEGLVGMRVGGQRQLTIPFSMAYGTSGWGDIPPAADLVFVVDLLEIFPGQPDWDFPDEVSGELEIQELTAGEGRMMEADELAIVNFAVATLSNQTELQSSWSTGQPSTMSTGEDVLPGIAQGLIGAQVGTLRRVIIPPDLAFGEAGQSGIGPNETLVLLVEVLELLGPIGSQ